MTPTVNPWFHGRVEFSVLIGFVGAVVVLNLVPGPGMMYLLAHGIIGGRKAGAIAALGMATGTVVHTAAAILGLSALLTAAPFVLDGVRIFGALVLAYLAFAALRDSRALNSEPKQKPEATLRTYISADGGSDARADDPYPCCIHNASA